MSGYRRGVEIIHAIDTHQSARKMLGVMMRIKDLRREKMGVSQAVMGDEIGMTQATISRIENGEQNTTVEKLERVAKYLGVSVPELFVQPEKPETLRRLEELLNRCSAEQQDAFLTILEASASVSGGGPDNGQAR